MGKPLSASAIAGCSTCAQGRRPCCWCAASSKRTVPGTPTARPPTRACGKGMGLPPGSTNRRSSAAAGAVSRPSQACSALPSQCSKNAPPPMPLDCGSTRVNTICTATAASSALPPARSIWAPASAASGLAAATANVVVAQPGLWLRPDAPSGRAGMPLSCSGAKPLSCSGSRAAHPTSHNMARQTTRRVQRQGCGLNGGMGGCAGAWADTGVWLGFA